MYEHSRVRVSAWWIVVVAAVVALATLAGILRLNRDEDQHRQAQVVLTEIDGELHRERLWELSALGRGRVADEIREGIDLCRTRLADRLARIHRLGATTPSVRSLADELAAYQADVDTELRLLAGGQLGNPSMVSAGERQAASTQFDAAVTAVETAKRVTANDADRSLWAEWLGETISLLGAGVVVSIVVWWYARARRRADLAAGEQRALRQSEARFRSLVQHSSDLILVVDLDGIVSYASPAVEHVLGIPPGAMVGQPAGDWVHPDDLGQGTHIMAGPSRDDVGPPVLLYRVRHADGRWRRLEVVSRNLIHDPAVRGIVINARDVTERVEADAALAESEARKAAILATALDAIITIDGDDRVIEFNQAAEQMFGYDREVVLGRRLADLIIPVPQRARHQEGLARALAAGDSRLAQRRMEMMAVRADGSEFSVEAAFAATQVDGQPQFTGFIRDITERKQFEDQLVHQAFHDALTGLPNRALLSERLAHALDRAGRGHGLAAVLFLDLDRFKVVNDSLGHPAGDALLVAVAERLRAQLRPGDTIARLGGDEFVVLLEDLEHPSAAVVVAERLFAALGPPIAVAGRELIITTSIGIALSNGGSETPAELLRDADVALYRAKSHGRGAYVVFDAHMNANAVDRLELENDLRHAVERGELQLHYQPEVDIDGRVTLGMEALLRWEHPRRGLLSPAAFISLAEETGLIVPIGRWVLSEACRQVSTWQEQGLARDLAVSVNLSPRQFQHPGLVDDVARALGEAALAPAALRLEITESGAMADVEATVGTLTALKRLGVEVVLDDFGTGYSSLSYLRRFPLDGLKVDRSFIEDMDRDGSTVAIIQTITVLAHTLGMDVTAEGVEHAADVEALARLGCDRVQGYYYARPMPAETMTGFLTAHAGAGDPEPEAEQVA